MSTLIERLPRETEPFLLEAIVERLRAASGRKDRSDPRPWRAWLAGLPADWRAPSAFEEDAPGSLDVRGAAAEDRTSACEFAGLSIRSDRIAFLIDMSGSIWKERSDGRTRKELVDRELGRVLLSLTESTRFNVIPYAEAPLPWRDALVDADGACVRKAAADFAKCHLNGTGNFWDAASLALEDPQVETLIVLTDGAPTGGRRHRLELIAALFLERNQFRRVRLDSILIGSTRKLERQWAELSAATQGRSIAVDW
jgi:hypothetical protein